MPAESQSNGEDASPILPQLKKSSKIFIRHAARPDFERLVDWTSNSVDDWELNVDDFDVWRRSFPPQSFLAAEDPHTGECVGFAAGVRHGSSTGFIGLYYVQREYRGRGVGALLWTEVLRRLDGTNMCLSAVPDMVAKYRDRNSFRCSENRVDENNGRDGGTRVKIACGFPKLEKFALNFTRSLRRLTPPPEGGCSIVDVTPDLLEAIFAYDQSICGVDRRSWCQNWLLNHRTGKSVVALVEKPASERPILGANVTRKCAVDRHLHVDDCEGVVGGFGQIHEIRPGRLKIGPLYADNHAIARALLLALLAKYPQACECDVHMAFQAGDQATEEMLRGVGLETLSDYYELFMFTKHEVPFTKARTIFFSDSAVNFV